MREALRMAALVRLNRGRRVVSDEIREARIAVGQEMRKQGRKYLEISRVLGVPFGEAMKLARVDG